MELFKVRRMRSPLLFCGDVYGQESRNRVPQEDRKLYSGIVDQLGTVVGLEAL
jgi:hypothetical protein